MGKETTPRFLAARKEGSGVSLYPLLLGQKFENLPSIAEMPESFLAPEPLVEVATKTVNDPEFWDREFSTVGFVNQEFKLEFTKIRKGKQARLVQGLSVGTRPVLMAGLDSLMKGVSRKARMSIHSHPLVYPLFQFPLSLADFCSFLGREFRAEGVLDMVSANPNQYEKQRVEKDVVVRLSLFVKNREFENTVAKPLVRAALKNFRPVPKLLEQLYKTGSFETLSHFLMVMSEFLAVNGISSYIALFQPNSETFVFKRTPRVSLDNLQEIEIHKGTGLLLPKLILTSSNEYFKTTGREVLERLFDVSDEWIKGFLDMDIPNDFRSWLWWNS